MAIKKEQIIHRTECIPGIIRNEIFEYEDIVYTESFDDETGVRMYGHITMYGGVQVCLVGADGGIAMSMPTTWVTDRKSMLVLQDDIKRLDEFLCMVVENYH